ncbi:hypothetical protein Q3G72_007690 [Acer saccharum]|nr:hypothetical protein Q3G72_007690 [Acer saccharum]
MSLQSYNSKTRRDKSPTNGTAWSTVSTLIYLGGGQKVDLVAISREVRRREPTFLLVLTRHYQGCDQIL